MSALHRFLIDFDREGSGAPRGSRPQLGRDFDPPAAFLTPEAELLDFAGDDLSAELAEPFSPGVSSDALAEAIAEALAEAEAAHGAALAAAAEQHAADLAEARLRWAAEEGKVLAEGLRAGMAALEDAVAEGAGAVLEPLMAETLRDAAITELRKAVGDLVLSGTGGRIAVSGPQDLVEGLQAALSEAGVETAGLHFTVAETADVSVTSDTSTIETRLGAWARTLQRRLGDDT